MKHDTQPFHLFDAHGRKRYGGFGNYRIFLPYLSFDAPARHRADHAVLWMQSVLGIKAGPCEARLWQKIKSAFGPHVQALLVYHAPEHKEAEYLGFVKSNDKEYFIKIFRRHEDLIYETYQIRFVQEHFTGPFVTVPVIHSEDAVLVQDFIRRQRDVGAVDHVQKKIVHLCEMFLSAARTKKQARDILPLSLLSVFNQEPYAALGQRIRQWAMQQTGLIDMTPIHGDMTPWNMFISPEEKHVLVDYHRSGWHVPYYDYFHYVLQPLAGKEKAPGLKKIKFDIDAYPARDQALALYLIDQLYHDLDDHLHKGIDTKLLHRRIASKTKWLDEIMGAEKAIAP